VPHFLSTHVSQDVTEGVDVVVLIVDDDPLVYGLFPSMCPFRSSSARMDANHESISVKDWTTGTAYNVCQQWY
jgi:hypothetical protein